MDLEMYKTELIRTRNQNDCERDLYYTVGEILRYSDPMEDLSLRDVSGRRHSKIGEVFYGLSAFPDLVILDSEFKNQDNAQGNIENADKIYGAVEVKALGSKLYDVEKFFESVQKGEIHPDMKNLDDQMRLLGECIWNKKLIYTNGIQWQIIECSYKNDEWKNICEVVKERISRLFSKNNKSQEDWQKKINFENILIEVSQVDMGVTKVKLENMNESQWDVLTKALNKITWKPTPAEPSTK